jgi:hypothetical protein
VEEAAAEEGQDAVLGSRVWCVGWQAWVGCSSSGRRVACDEPKGSA